MTTPSTKNNGSEEQEALQSIKVSRIILPILIGAGVVIYLFLTHFNWEEFQQISWTSNTWFWVSIATILLIIRHLAYAIRLRILSEGFFSWRKCIELIFIWEFSSAVSPTSVGGSAVALFVLAQEKLASAKVTAIVLFTAVLDTIFFIGTLPILFFFFGTNMIRPDMQQLNDLDGWGYTFLGAYVLMACYGSLFFYGLFIKPQGVGYFLRWVTKFWPFQRFQEKADQLGKDFIIASKEMKSKHWTYHIGGFLATATAWSCRFLLVNCLIIGLIATTKTDFWSQFALYARLETMYVVMAISPTPGGVGFAEILFNGFLTDYVTDETVSSVIAIIWRLMTYYLYLFVGAIIIPNWLRQRLNERKR